jgi:hypothetical protein
MNGAIEGQDESIAPASAAIEDERTLDHREQHTLSDADVPCCHEAAITALPVSTQQRCHPPRLASTP